MQNTLAIVIVLYQMRLAETPAYQLLKKFVDQGTLNLIIYDNSPLPQSDQLMELVNVVYIHDSTNPGLAKAYNTALNYCQVHQIDLLLLLDQDTHLSEDYLQLMVTKQLKDEIAVYIPVVEAQGQQISPVASQDYIRGNSQTISPGIYQTALMAINSGTVLTSATMNWLGEFQEAFPLDFLDHWFFWQLHQARKKVEVVAVTIQQELSVLDYRSVSLTRYESIVRAESLFYQQYDRSKFAVHKRHLLLRAAKQFLLVSNRKIWRRTMQEFLHLRKESK